MHIHLSYARSSALLPLIANGVTTVRDLGSDLAELDRWRAEIADNTQARTGNCPVPDPFSTAASSISISSRLQTRRTRAWPFVH